MNTTTQFQFSSVLSLKSPIDSDSLQDVPFVSRFMHHFQNTLSSSETTDVFDLHLYSNQNSLSSADLVSLRSEISPL